MRDYSMRVRWKKLYKTPNFLNITSYKNANVNKCKYKFAIAESQV